MGSRWREWRVTGRMVTALVLFLGVFGLYVWTAAPTVTFHDSGELITAACTLGIPHPPGAPTWCLLGHLFSRIPWGTVAWRLNVMSGFFGALTCALTWWLVEQLVAAGSRVGRGWARLAGVAAALALAQAPAFWQKAVQAELYTLNAFFLLLVLISLERWGREAEPGRGWLILLGGIFGVGAGNYMALLYYVPVVALAVLVRRPATVRDVRVLAGGIAAFVVGFSVHGYLLIRSAADPGIDWGNPDNWERFAWVMRREQWGALSWRHLSGAFIREWLRSIDLAGQFHPCLILVGLAGLWAGWRRRWMMGILVGSFLVYALAMMLMQSTTPALTGDMAYVTVYGLAEFHIPLYVIMAIWFGLGVGYLPGVWKETGRPVRSVHGILMALILAGLVLGVRDRYAVGNYRDFRAAAQFGEDLLASVASDALVLPGTDNAMFVLTYQRYCEGRRPDVRLVAPAAALLDWLRAEVEGGNTGLTARAIQERIAGDPDRQLMPLLNGQTWQTATGGVYFVKVPSWSGLHRLIHPDGLVFRWGTPDADVLAHQTAYWENLWQREERASAGLAQWDHRENRMRVLRDHAWWHLAHGDTDWALRLYEEAVRVAPAEFPDLLAEAAEGAVRAGDYGAAGRYAERALAKDGRLARAWMAMGIAHVAYKRFEKAGECFANVLDIEPQNTIARENFERARLQAAGAVSFPETR